MDAPRLLRIGRVIKTARMQFGLSTNDLADELGISQRTVCRLEAGLREPTDWEIQHITGKFAITRDDLYRGFIERPSGALIGSRLRIPGQFSDGKNSKVRMVKLFPMFYEKAVGSRLYREFIEDRLRVRPEYFYDNDNEVNVPFVNTFLDHMISERVLTPDSLSDLVSPVSKAVFHGLLGLRYLELGTVPAIVVAMIQNMSAYESAPNFHYRVETEGSNYVIVSAKMSEHFRKFKRPASLGDFECRYLQAVFSEPKNMVRDLNCELRVDHLSKECGFKRADRCIYRISVNNITRRSSTGSGETLVMGD